MWCFNTHQLQELVPKLNGPSVLFAIALEAMDDVLGRVSGVETLHTVQIICCPVDHNVSWVGAKVQMKLDAHFQLAQGLGMVAKSSGTGPEFRAAIVAVVDILVAGESHAQEFIMALIKAFCCLVPQSSGRGEEFVVKLDNGLIKSLDLVDQC